MPKIRGVKPDLWTDEDFVELSPFARLLWVGMWNYACDNGHLADKSKQIKMRILPTDEVNCAELLREVESRGLIERADGWITIPNLARHQKVDRRYFTTCEKEGCDDPPETVSQRAARRAPAVHTPGTPRAHDERTPGARGDGEVKGSDGDGEVKGARKKRAHQLPDDFAPNEQHRRLAAELGLNLQFEFAKFRDYWIAEGKPKADWDATLRNWLRGSRNARPQPALTVVTPEGNVDESALPPVEQSWMKRRPR